jgi:hypothetical protein
MILSASLLTTAQKCPRRYLLEKDSPDHPRWNPRELFAAVFRQGVLNLSNPGLKLVSPHTVFRAQATSPGLDCSKPWEVAEDCCAALSTSLEAISRLALPVVSPGPLVPLGEGLEWQVQSFVAESGELHRWAVVERFDEGALFRESHSWHVFGDMAALDTPMTLHFLELGPIRDGHLRSPWARAFSQPDFVNHFRFQRVGGGALRGKWKEIWFDRRQDPKTWVDLMEKDGLQLLTHVPLKGLSKKNVEDFLAHAKWEAARLEALPPLESLPLYRPACDIPGPCPWQFKCYA